MCPFYAYSECSGSCATNLVPFLPTDVILDLRDPVLAEVEVPEARQPRHALVQPADLVRPEVERLLGKGRKGRRSQVWLELGGFEQLKMTVTSLRTIDFFLEFNSLKKRTGD